jgi:hypothetical protein
MPAAVQSRNFRLPVFFCQKHYKVKMHINIILSISSGCEKLVCQINWKYKLKDFTNVMLEHTFSGDEMKEDRIKLHIKLVNDLYSSFPSRFSDQNVCAFLFSAVRATCHAVTPPLPSIM